MKLETERLTIRQIALTDVDAIFKYRSDKQTNRFQGWIPEKIEDVHIFMGKVAEEFNQAETWFQLVIIDKAMEQIIGDIGIHFIDEAQVEVGCTLDIHMHGKGYATESLHSVISYLFKELSKHRVTTSIDPKNTGSIALVERLGFRKEAHFVESLWLNGEWVDDVVYSVLNKEWK